MAWASFRPICCWYISFYNLGVYCYPDLDLRHLEILLGNNLLVKQSLRVPNYITRSLNSQSVLYISRPAHGVIESQNWKPIEKKFDFKKYLKKIKLIIFLILRITFWPISENNRMCWKLNKNMYFCCGHKAKGLLRFLVKGMKNIMLKQKHSHYLQVSPNSSFNLPLGLDKKCGSKFH